MGRSWPMVLNGPPVTMALNHYTGPEAILRLWPMGRGCLRRYFGPLRPLKCKWLLRPWSFRPKHELTHSKKRTVPPSRRPRHRRDGAAKMAPLEQTRASQKKTATQKVPGLVEFKGKTLLKTGSKEIDWQPQLPIDMAS